jgi:hypothetical protein
MPFRIASKPAPFLDSRELKLNLTAEEVFQPIQRIGGETGWYFGNLLWQVRGFVDSVLGGVGMRRGRAHPLEIRVGDHLDFWLVEAFEPNRQLRLMAEMKLPGRAWLEFLIEDDEYGCILKQTAAFYPTGVGGLLYWYALYPVHMLIFAQMIRNIARAAVKTSVVEATGPGLDGA